MINPKRLIPMAKKWQRMAANKPKRISCPKSDVGLQSSVANKGHFVVYTTDNKRFVVPLEYLSKNVFRELLRMSEEEFGLPSNGPIRLPCDSTLLEYVIYLVQAHMAEYLEKALLTSMAKCHCSCSASYCIALGQNQQQPLINGF
ncbi:auxin-responsive protein SAUR64-like [Juglans microcarpa x Juglans regia]|uniref:auxin-responsive protein SAUR64-like n=1 Tax=Juglans microcarpa x Juglans regia TaxID=2249226 RepID=UPI001B7F34E7|nr:auxin-responsive protein SAUR64-like [Juglans microcarpa x Juglans regia]